ncbi:Mpp10 protein, partial [Metschnikowia bicuspidata]
FNQLTKALLDPFAKDHSVLDEVYTDGLDSTQVFGQAQMVINGMVEKLLREKLPELKELYGAGLDPESGESGAEQSGEEEFFLIEESPCDEEKSEGSKAVQDHEESDEEVKEGDEVEEEPKVNKDVFGLNDEFFDIDEFNKLLLALEEPEQDDEEVDLFADLSGDDSEGEEMEYYDEFFDKPGQGKRKTTTKTNDDDEDLDRELEDAEYKHAVDSAMHDLFGDEDEAEAPTKRLSTFEKQQQKLLQEIAQLEAELVAEKKWTMKGEVRSKDRPVDSLLNDDEAPTLEFDRTSKPVPVITDKLTETIEDLIKRRIKDDEFDDLPRRLVSDVRTFVQKQKAEVSDQKSTKSLAEIYEDEFHGVDPDAKISEEVEAAHAEITQLFTQLNYKLDSLCLAHYIPMPIEYKSVEIKVTDAPASISTDDAQPLNVSDEVKLAPQEIYKIGDDKVKAYGAKGTSQVLLKSGLSYSKDELSRDDKQRLRRAKKRAKSKHFNELKEIREQREKERTKTGGDRKRQRVGEAMETLSRSKNVTVIDKKGQLRDALGNIKRAEQAPDSSRFRL